MKRHVIALLIGLGLIGCIWYILENAYQNNLKTVGESTLLKTKGLVNFKHQKGILKYEYKGIK